MDRLLIVAALGAALAVAAALARGWARRRARELVGTPAGPLWESLGTSPDGRPAVVAFSTAGCRECGVQMELLSPLIAGGVRLLTVDAGRRPEAAKAFGVLTVPSTIVLDESGSVVAINHGLADGDRLRNQLASGPVMSI